MQIVPKLFLVFILINYNAFAEKLLLPLSGQPP